MFKHPQEISCDGHFLIFATDFSSYHLPFIRSGIQSYFEKGSHQLSYIQMDITELRRLFGKSVNNRIAVIGTLRNPEALTYFKNNNIPCLNLNGDSPDAYLGFDVQFEAEGSEAAKYFLEEMKLENLGFVGFTPSATHLRRLREFQREAKAHRLEVSVCELEKGTIQAPFYLYSELQLEKRHAQTIDFLSKIPKPAGIFCGDDRLALNFYYTAEMMGFSVPNEIAIMGVSSRSNAKEPWADTVSAVQIDHYRQGYAAAKLMDEFISRRKVPNSVRIKPSGIHHGQTTIRRSAADSLVREAMMLIQRNPEISVNDLAEKFNTSRRIMDIRFQRSTNMTAAKAIEIERFTKAKRLIKENEYSLESIAGLAGYPNRRSMRRSFYRFTKMNPQQFRELGSIEAAKEE